MHGKQEKKYTVILHICAGDKKRFGGTSEDYFLYNAEDLFSLEKKRGAFLAPEATRILSIVNRIYRIVRLKHDKVQPLWQISK
jgi:hypothetical protein